MKSQAERQPLRRFTEGNKVNQGRSGRSRSALARGASFWSFLHSLCSLLFNALRPAVLFAAVALLPTFAQGEAIEAWVQRYDGRGDRIDSSARGMAVDASGNVYVTGTSLCNGPVVSSEGATIKYSSVGVPLWTNYLGYVDSSFVFGEGMAIAVDPAGDVVVLSFGPDVTPIKYSSAGIPLWTNRSYRTQAPYRTTDPNAMALDAQGNVFVAGMADDYSAGIEDYLVLKYSSDGKLLWTRTYNGHGSAVALAVDAEGNVAVTGRSSTTQPGSSDYLTLKYSSTGALLWTQRYNGPGKGVDVAWAVAVDSEDCVIVTGLSDGGTNIVSVATIKYSSAGEPIWTNRHNENWGWTGPILAVDASGSVFVTGSAASGMTQDYLTLKYSSAGVPLWTNRYHPGNYLLDPKCLALDSSGNAFVTGHASDRATWADSILTVGYSNGGVELWAKYYNGPGPKFDWPVAVGVDANGSVYVAGSSEAAGSGDGAAADFDYVTIKYVTPPFITRQPVSCTNAVGTAASFTVEVAGSAPLTFQWHKGDGNLLDGGFVSGVSSTNLLIADVQLSDAGDYTMVVTNEWGTATSTIAHLTVTVPPSAGRFTNFKYSPETGLSFVFRDATVGQPYRIQRSPAMAEGNWTDWQNFNYTEPVGLMDVSATGAERRFYRAVSP